MNHGADHALAGYYRQAFADFLAQMGHALALSPTTDLASFHSLLRSQLLAFVSERPMAINGVVFLSEFGRGAVTGVLTRLGTQRLNNNEEVFRLVDLKLAALGIIEFGMVSERDGDIGVQIISTSQNKDVCYRQRIRLHPNSAKTGFAVGVIGTEEILPLEGRSVWDLSN